MPFTEARLGALRLRNRIVLSPMSRMQAREDGCASVDMAAYYARYARHGVALVMTEATYVDEAESRAYFNQPGMANARHLAAWRPVVEAVHAQGTPIFLQLQHGGRLAEPGLHPAALGVDGASAKGNSWQMGRPYADSPLHAATARDLDGIVESFARAARHAFEAGFDGVELHGARGYFLDEWLSQPGRDLEHRLSLPRRVVRAVRDGFPGVLTYNWSLYKMDDVAYQPPGTADEVRAVAQALLAEGIDALHVSTRRVLKPEPYGEAFAKTVRAATVGTPLIVNGGIRTLADAQAALSETGAELIALARALLANPDWIGKARAGAALDAYAPGMERRPLLEAQESSPARLTRAR